MSEMKRYTADTICEIGDEAIEFVPYEDAMKRIKELEDKVLALQEFAIWMTGCGYEFTQHDYFCEQRDKLLKGE